MKSVYILNHRSAAYLILYCNWFTTTKFHFYFLLFIGGRFWWFAPKQIKWQKELEYLLLRK